MTSKIDLAEYYFELLKNLDADSKLQLIELLSHSMREKASDTDVNSLQSLFGAWQSDDSAEDIIANIRNRPIAGIELEDWTMSK